MLQLIITSMQMIDFPSYGKSHVIQFIPTFIKQAKGLIREILYHENDQISRYCQLIRNVVNFSSLLHTNS